MAQQGLAKVPGCLSEMGESRPEASLEDRWMAALEPETAVADTVGIEDDVVLVAAGLFDVAVHEESK